MVDEAGRDCRGLPLSVSAATFRDEVRFAYDVAAPGWANGAGVVYGALAEELVALLPSPVPGTVLDLCAGTGVVSAVLGRRGLPVIAADLAEEMLRVNRSHRPASVAADAVALPFRSAAFGAVVVAFGLNHTPDPVGFLSETCRVTAAGGSVLASTFAGGWPHPAKAVVDEVLAGFGFRSPGWYDRLKRELEGLTGSLQALLDIAQRAELRDVQALLIEVAPPVTVDEVVGWRFSMASHAGFIASLPAATRRHVAKVAATEVRRCWEPLVIPMLVLSARV